MEIICRQLARSDPPLVLAMDHTFQEGFAALSAARTFLQNPSNWL